MWRCPDINHNSGCHQFSRHWGGLVVSLSLAVAMSLSGPQPAWAQTSSTSTTSPATSASAADDSAYDLAISPPVTYAQVKPGENLTHTITVENKGQQSLMVSPKLIDFQASDTGSGLDLQAENSFPYLTNQSRTVLTETFTLNPGEKHRLELIMAPPIDAVEKEYHLTLLFVAAPVDYPRLVAGAHVSGAIGSNLIVFVSPQTANKGKLKLKEVKAPQIIDSLSAITFQVLAENVGNQATTASGSARILNWRHQTVAEFEFFPDMVLANSLRQLRPSQPATEAAQLALEPAASSSFRYKPLFLIGPYTIEVTFESASTQEPLTFQVLALPFSLLLVVILTPITYMIVRYITKLPIAR